jgi:hypothetical protein
VNLRQQLKARGHGQLWSVAKKLPSDYEPWGERPDEERGPDCSCNCKFFHPLEGMIGMDWGICFNPKSPRAGLLTFEHMGCRQFKQGKEL